MEYAENRNTDYPMNETKNAAEVPAQSKFDLWEKKLLDLSRRNQLIDFKRKGKGLQVLYYDMQSLFDAFESRRKSYALCEAELHLTEQDSLELPCPEDIDNTEARLSLEREKLLLIRRCSDIPVSLKYFFRERKKAFEETGSNVFYLALGFVAWHDAERENAECFSPLILVPVDLKRSSKDSYSLTGRDETPFLNISAFQFFRQEYKVDFDDLLSAPLFDGDTADVEKIFGLVEQKLHTVPGMRVVRAAALNIFNFSKAVMWQDLRYRRGMLREHKVIRSILNGNYVLDETEKNSAPYDDETTLPGDMAIPLSADSSQLTAIKDCAEGRSFILQGPPGTGKSQTITNMIVNAVYHGKTVLFVAEKMAALEVVQKRLKKLNLDAFALETHSVKSDKAAIMEQFDRRIKLGITEDNAGKYSRISDELMEKRQEINRVIAKLHRKNDFFLSFYDAFVHYLEIGAGVPTVELPTEYVRSLTEDSFEKNRERADAYRTLLWENGGYRNHPFLLYRNARYVPGTSKQALIEALPAWEDAAEALVTAYRDFLEENGADCPFDRKTADTLLSVLGSRELENTLPALVGTALGDSEEFRALLVDGADYFTLVRELRQQYNDGIFSLDAETAAAAYAQNRDAFFLARMVKNNRLCKAVREYAKNPKAVKADALPALYADLSRKKTLEGGIRKAWNRFFGVLGAFPEAELQTYDFALLKQRAENTFALSDLGLSRLGEERLRLLCERAGTFSLKGKDALLAVYRKWKETEQRFSADFSFDFSLCETYGIGYDAMPSAAEKMRKNTDALANWCALLTAGKTCAENGLQPVLDYAADTPLPELDDLGDVFAKSVYARILSEVIADKDGTSFNSVELTQRIESYRNLIDTFSVQIIKETAARITADTPLINEDSPASSEQGILNRAIRNRCRGKSIRQLFGETKHVVTKLFPVFLMSPLSCAQFLSPEMPKFDIVIFDEASQMPTAEAVGAISRGNSLIVVGDSKQMPPTAFFKSQGDEDEYTDLDDQDSILDDCDVIGLPSNYLLWHYRSRHESLIRFSNVKFYHNRLTTFPSPNDRESKVSFRNVGGVYEMKKATNEGEADAIAEEIRRRLSDPELRKSSIGVVTFSAVQQELVEDKVAEMFAAHRDLEKFNLDSAEPLIVKNLENIQGDERDVILFSICYGPDADGKMYFRFGPINNAGGEKRLNVAVSRARSEMIVFASFEPDCMAAMKSDAAGAQALYAFLRYAKYGADTLTVDKEDAAAYRSGIEEQIARRLAALGYEVQTDVGNSGFRVDIGVVNPLNPQEYLLGIVIDSYSYEAAKTARDRNVVQPSVLEGLGWNLYRVWSFDFYDNPDKVIHDIIQRIEQVRLVPASGKEEKPAVDLHVDFVSRTAEKISYAVVYAAYTGEHDFSAYTVDYQFSKAALPVVEEILKKEAPISADLLYSRFASAIGAARVGTRMRAAVDNAVKALACAESRNFAGTVTFYWRKEQSMQLSFYRTGGDRPREAADLPKEEILVAVRETLENHGALPLADLKSCVAECFGFRQLRGKISDTLDDAVAYYRQAGILEYHAEDSRIYLR